MEVKTGPTTALQAMRRLCIPADIPKGPVTRVPTPPAIAEVEDQVEAVRELTFERRVNVEPVTPEEIDRRLGEYLDVYYPKRFYARRSDAWATIGAIPRDIGILGAIDAYQQGQVLGFYDSQNGELVYTGDADLDRLEHFVLAHELTHAIDDQHFDLDRLDDLVVRCEDEPFQAALGIVEGSANHFATQVLLRFPVATTGPGSGDGPAVEVPPLMLEIFAYPYTAGQRFADALADEGGPAAVDRALRKFPTTTEQILHPSKYPGDVAEPVEVPDFAPTFGPGWRDRDVMVVGEVWLKALLNLRLEESDAASAAAGWDGGIYRAWSDGDDVAVILSTVWDTPADAEEFSEALSEWVSQGSAPGLVLEAEGTRVHAGFASSEALVGAVSSALASL
ncbi:MAG: hypothetical protein M3M93_03465 [Actinomycetota bacterium]|nr:hypothetical protein [Actinomycetota bacterium]